MTMVMATLLLQPMLLLVDVNLKCNKKKKEKKRPKRGGRAPLWQSKGLFISGFFFFSFASHNKLESLGLILFQLSKDVFAKIKPRTPNNYNSYSLQFENNKIQTLQKLQK